ncbi:glycosyltransferase family A protein [Xanthomonas sacchari]|uniref:glycosyltransferase family A protein n=1 Tax=Xanthomonas TaxID=338 RepID=UPI00225DF34F|nr:glycosyltransferase family A protein [Xanthomonas sacchari]
MLTLLTATGARPDAWRLCERWMCAQDYPDPVRWIVVDDGPSAQTIGFVRDGWHLEVVRPSPAWEVGQNTQARNLLAGLEAVASAERVVIVEDDDWYAPDWLSHVASELESADLVGECRARYYNIRSRLARQMSNNAHASLCSTAVKGEGIEALREACRRQPKFIDLELWRHARYGRVFSGHRVVGIKGLPGRLGIGIGHVHQFTGQYDVDGAILRAWVGQDAALYEQVASR